MNFKEILKKAIWAGVKRHKGKKREYITTNDLNADRTLKKNYKSKRKKKKEESKGYGIGPDL